MNGPITGAQAVTIGSVRDRRTAGQRCRATSVRMPTALGQNTYTGGTTLNNARVVIGADAFYTGGTNAPTIISSPFGTGSLTFGAGNNNGGTFIGSDGTNRVIPRRARALAPAATLTTTFEGRGGLQFNNTSAACNLE